MIPRRLPSRLIACLLMAWPWLVSAAGAQTEPDPPTATEPQPLSAPTRIRLRADTVEGSFLRRFWRGRGNVTVSADGQSVRADEAAVDLAEGTANASGNVLLRVEVPRPENERFRRRRRLGPLTAELSTQSLEYDFVQARGRAEDVEARFHNLTLSAGSASFDGDRLRAEDVTFGACAEAEPFYRLTARSIDAQLGDRAVARRVRLYIGRTKLVSVPRVPIDLTRSGESGTRHLPLPSVGRSSLAGGYLQWGLAFQPFTGAQTTLRLQATEKQGVRYFSQTRGFTGPSPVLRLYYKEEQVGREVRRVLVNRLPEVGLLLDGASRSRLSRWITGELTYGRVREVTTGVSTDRLNFMISGLSRSIGGYQDWDLDLQPGVRVTRYGTGDTYRDAYVGLSLVRHVDSRNRTEVSFVQHALGGRTPFAFDEVFLPTELTGRWLKSFGRYSLDLAANYDVRRGELFDYKIGLGYVVRCVEPKLVFRGRTRSLGLELGLVGFSLDEAF